MSRDRIRIARVIARLNIGGPAQHVIILSAGLDPSRFETLLIAGQEEPGEGSLRDRALAQGVNLRVLPGLRREIRLGRDLRMLATLLGTFRTLRPHIVHTHTAKAGTLGRLAARLAGVPLILHTFHGHVLQGYFGPATTRLFRLIERGLGRLSTRILVLSERQRREILALGIGTADRVVVLPLGLPLQRLLDCQRRRGELRRELALPASAKLVGIVGRLVPIKGHALFLDAAALLSRRRTDVRFLIAGDGELRPALEAQAQELGLAGRIHFLGWRLDLERIYADLDLAALSSYNEGTPVCLLEAMAAGLPVVSTDVGGVADIVEHGKTGLLVPPGDPGALAGAMEAILDDRIRGEEMGAAGRLAAYPAYDAATLLDRMTRLYDNLLERRL